VQEVAASRRAHGTVLVAGNARQLQRYALKTTLRRDSCSYHSRLLASFHSVSDARGQPATGGYHARYRTRHLHIKTYWFSTFNTLSPCRSALVSRIDGKHHTERTIGHRPPATHPRQAREQSEVLIPCHIFHGIRFCGARHQLREHLLSSFLACPPV
jgi:hypothetical protein